MGQAPTNNLAEQAIRFLALDRHVTQGTRSPQRRQWYARICSASATRIPARLSRKSPVLRGQRRMRTRLVSDS